jgi:hypothetical protein
MQTTRSILDVCDEIDDMADRIGDEAGRIAVENIEKNKRRFLYKALGVVFLIGFGAFIYFKKRRDKKRKVSST